LIVGLDAFYGFPNWHRWRDLFRLAHIAVMQRPDAPPAAWAGALAEALGERLTENPGDLLTAPAGRVMLLEVTQLAISATGIRQLLSRGKSPRYLLPDPVLRMIETEGLYRAY
jgi:nicotinate-nucleotide adenylyltransferase